MSIETRIRAAIAVVLTCMSAVAAQEPAVFRARTDLVLVPVWVTDQNGRFVHGLTSGDFEISEEGARRAVQQFSAERVPVSLIILLDISGSMAQTAQERLADDARWADTRRALADHSRPLIGARRISISRIPTATSSRLVANRPQDNNRVIASSVFPYCFIKTIRSTIATPILNTATIRRRMHKRGFMACNCARRALGVGRSA